jgi:hypothetical protein
MANSISKDPEELTVTLALPPCKLFADPLNAPTGKLVMTYELGFLAGFSDYQKCPIIEPFGEVRKYATTDYQKGFIDGQEAAFNDSQKSH